MRGSGNTTLTGTTNSAGAIGADDRDYTFKFLPNSASTNISIIGDISTLIDYQNKSNTVPYEYCFGYLFGGQKAITQVNELILPYTTLTA